MMLIKILIKGFLDMRQFLRETVSLHLNLNLQLHRSPIFQGEILAIYNLSVCCLF